jgi:hypothetical protein
MQGGAVPPAASGREVLEREQRHRRTGARERLNAPALDEQAGDVHGQAAHRHLLGREVLQILHEVRPRSVEQERLAERGEAGVQRGGIGGSPHHASHPSASLARCQQAVDSSPISSSRAAASKSARCQLKARTGS